MACKQKIIKCFNSSAYNYDNAADIQPLAARRLARLLPPLAARNILEIGCGTGLFSQYLIQRFPQANLLLTDIAVNMIEVCRQRLALQNHHSVAQMDGEDLTTTENFDLIASNMTVHWFTDLKKSFQQIISRLTPGGKFIFSMPGKNSLQEWREICESKQVSIATPEFMSAQQLQAFLPRLKIETRLIKQYYPSALKFLQTLKSIGASAPRRGHEPLNSGRLRQLLRAFDQKYPAGAHISYEIIYGSYEKQ